MSRANVHHPIKVMTPLLLALPVPCGAVGLAGQVPQNANAKQWREVVRVRYTEGEVKFSPGQNGKPVRGDHWVQAAPRQPIEDGNTLATEKGRAEIEFENRTVVYLAEGAVLRFKKLRAGPGTTDTQLDLLTGTARRDIPEPATEAALGRCCAREKQPLEIGRYRMARSRSPRGGRLRKFIIRDQLNHELQHL